MLVLTRRPSEGDPNKTTIIGHGVEVDACLGGGQVDLDLHVHRSKTGGAMSGLMSARWASKAARRSEPKSRRSNSDSRAATFSW